MNNLRIFQVKANWSVFRIPVSEVNNIETYNMLYDWLTENCVGTFKIFRIYCGAKSTPLKHTCQHESYGDLVQVDLLDEVDVVAFKLKWL